MKVRTKEQVSVTEKVWRQVELEVGDEVEVEGQGSESGSIPKSEIDKGDDWFWSKEWQEKEREADEALAQGEYEEFDNVEALIRDLRS